MGCSHLAHGRASRTETTIRLASTGFLYEGNRCYICVREKLRTVRKEEEVARHAREAEMGQIDVCYTMSALLASEAAAMSVGVHYVICCTVFELRANCCALVPNACLL